MVVTVVATALGLLALVESVYHAASAPQHWTVR
jgi:hypothetical protein